MAIEKIRGRYRLLEPLGGGAMASVWLADDEELGRRVAVKLLGPDADRLRFEREARAAAALAHPNICQLFDYGEEQGRPYMVLEHLAGGTLEERLATGRPLPDEETERIAREVAAGLAHAHERGLVHRDLKPANVLFDAEGRAKIADFGIARMGGAGTLTEAGTVLGTAAYISPEQGAGQIATPASDVYSFGVILFRMLTGRLPFESANAMELVSKHLRETPPPVSAYRTDAPAVLESVATAALAKAPGDRPSDGAALIAELGGAPATATAPLPLSGPPTQVLPRAGRRPPRRSRRGLLAALAAAALLAAGIAVAVVATGSGGSGAGTTPSLPGIKPPAASGGTSTRATTAPATTAPTTTEQTTSSETTTQQTTTHATEATTTAPTTAPATTAPPPTTEPPPTTQPPTTQPPPTTDTVPTDSVGTTVQAP